MPRKQLTGVICMAYGSPRDEAGLEAYYTHIRGGRPPSPEALEELRGRYRAIGGRSPLEKITRAQAAALAERLQMPTFVGMKHAPPFIEEAVAEARAAGVTRLVGLPLAPHPARMSFAGYERPLREGWSGELVFVNGFHDHPSFTAALRGLISETLAYYRPDRVFFTAHSLPARIVAEGDDYPGRITRSARLLEDRMDMPPWEVAFQSASQTGEPWLGPDLLEAIARSGARRVLVCPVGFVADHLEILYDLDVEAQAWARQHKVELRRTPMFNDRSRFIDALTAVVRDALALKPIAERT
ncbi:MAG TPA: ferrochelatase [Candidatus Dormibacteraeota bacterium]